MGDVTLKCPLCCNDTFTSRELLVEHLGNTIANLFCPICNSKCTSVLHLIEHVSHDNCTQVQTVQVQLQPNPIRTIIPKGATQNETNGQLKDSNLLEFKNGKEKS